MTPTDEITTISHQRERAILSRSALDRSHEKKAHLLPLSMSGADLIGTCSLVQPESAAFVQ
jgi:hypothetical protein